MQLNALKSWKSFIIIFWLLCRSVPGMLMVLWNSGMHRQVRKFCVQIIINNNNNDNLNTPGSRTVSSCEQYGTNLRRGDDFLVDNLRVRWRWCLVKSTPTPESGCWKVMMMMMILIYTQILSLSSYSSSSFILKSPFLPRSARVGLLPRYEVSPHIPEQCPFRLQAELFHVIIHTLSRKSSCLCLCIPPLPSPHFYRPTDSQSFPNLHSKPS